jgi:hypothetical protein
MRRAERARQLIKRPLIHRVGFSRRQIQLSRIIGAYSTPNAAEHVYKRKRRARHMDMAVHAGASVVGNRAYTWF